MPSEAKGVVVVGSITADVTAFSTRLPVPGETVLGNDLTLVLGGKGANQAISAAHYGSPTWFAGCVGDDLFANLTRDGLRDHGVHSEWLDTVEGPTGVAHIRVDASGQNDIVITPLANAALDEARVDRALAGLAEQVGVLLLQFETRVEIARHAAGVARDLGLTVIVDPAPAVDVDPDLWPLVDIVTPNESEASRLTGVEVTGVEAAEAAAGWFLDRGVRRAVITLGDLGSVSVDADGAVVTPAYRVEAVDTTAAGDAFTGTLGAAIAQGVPHAEGLRVAAAAGALAVTRHGASPSLPGREETLALAYPQREEIQA
ncbi:MAG: ribokinase [Nocardioidaceae bacterium]